MADDQKPFDPQITRVVPIPGRQFLRGRRCENCSYFRGDTQTVEQYFLTRLGINRSYADAALKLEQLRRAEADLEIAKEEYRRMSDSFTMLTRYANVQKRVATLRKETENVKDTVLTPQGPTARVLTAGELQGLERIRASRAGICTIDASESDFVSPTYLCSKWRNPHVKFDDGMGLDKESGELEEMADFKLKRGF